MAPGSMNEWRAKLARDWPGLFRAVRMAVRTLVGAYWSVRKVVEPVLSPRVERLRTALRLVPLQLSCVLSFFGLLPRLRGAVDPNRVVMVAYANLPHDPRIEREARALAEAGFSITVICPTLGNKAEGTLDWGPGVSFEFVEFRAAQFVFRWPGFVGDVLFKALLKHRPFAIHAHDLNMAFIAFAAARRSGARVVVDFHEWFSENVELEAGVYAPLRPRWRRAYRWLERHSLARADLVVTVCDSIADAMASELGGGRRPEVIRNIPRLSAEPTRTYRPLKEELGLAPERFLLLYQGGLGPSRLLEPVIEALAFAERCTLLIRGPNIEHYAASYREIAERAGAGERLILQGPVASRDVVAAARGADAGIWSLPNLCRNFTFALPNKIFEYVAAGLPALVADYPEARRLVETHQMGLTFDPYDPRSIAAAVNRLIDDPALRERMAGNTAVALQELDAEREWARLASLYLDMRRNAEATS
jgi:glycosyltransferase involved in cell wall biosynthesis